MMGIIENYADFVENNICYYPGNADTIKLKQWQKEVLNKVCGNTKINKVWILTERKTGASSLCKWLHWFRTEVDQTYCFSHSFGYSKMLAKNLPIIIKDISCKDDSEVMGIDCFTPITLNKFKAKVQEDKELEDLLDIKPKYHFMYDSPVFDFKKYNELSKYDYSLFTICINLKEYDKVKSILEKDKNKDNVLIIIVNGFKKINEIE